MYVVNAAEKNNSAIGGKFLLDRNQIKNFFDDLFRAIPYSPGINNKLFTHLLNPHNPPPDKPILKLLLQNWLEQKRILRRALVKGLESTVYFEYWQGQMAYLELLQDEIRGKHVELCWESISQIANVANVDLTHSIDAQNLPIITDGMQELRDWQAVELNDMYKVLIAIAIFEHQAQPVLRRTYQALNAWFGDKLNDDQRKKFELYFSLHTSIEDITPDTSFEDITVNIPKNDGVEEKHAAITRDCYIEIKQDISDSDLSNVKCIFDEVNAKQNAAWLSIYQKAVSL